MAAKKPEEIESAAAEQPAEETTLLRFVGVPYSGTLMIGVESFEVVDGKVRVPGRLFAAAHQAGFRA
jgi:hypothetical protein